MGHCPRPPPGSRPRREGRGCLAGAFLYIWFARAPRGLPQGCGSVPRSGTHLCHYIQRPRAPRTTTPPWGCARLAPRGPGPCECVTSHFGCATRRPLRTPRARRAGSNAGRWTAPVPTQRPSAPPSVRPPARPPRIQPHPRPRPVREPTQPLPRRNNRVWTRN